jgi:diguanylate cyclase (GGDEF)-like protein/PAS domain S-box-containing protein
MPLLKKVLSELDLIVFEQVDIDLYDCLQVVPEWFNKLYQEKIEENQTEEPDSNALPYFQLANAFPFLVCFFEEVEENESVRHQAKYLSGLWTEEMTNGKEYQLTATIVCIDDRVFVVIENKTPSFSEQHRVIQKARDIALVNEKLALDLHIHQRKLQDLIETQINNNTNFSDIEKLVDNRNSAVLVCKSDGEIQISNQALINIYSANSAHELGQHSLLDTWVAEAEKQYPEIKIALKAGAGWEGEFETKDMVGQQKWIRLAISPLYDTSKTLTHYICIANDINELKMSQESLLSDSIVDALTKLPNRHQFWKKFTLTLKECAQNNEQFALLTLDIDFFKRINNDFGYTSGDFLLTVLASRIKACVKNLDYIAHLGGDEFAVILRNVPTPETTHIIANRLFESINEPVSLEQTPIRVTCSMGTAVYPLHGSCEKELMQHAELAMYYAKELGRNQLQIYNHGLQNVNFKVEREKELSLALSEHQFFIEYQPQINLNPTKEFRVEALIRWHHKELGIVAPSDFIPLAEQTGLIVPIGKWVIEMVCLQIKVFNAQNIPCIVAINVSPVQLQHSAFVDNLKAIVDDFHIDPKHIEIEVTESLFENGLGLAIKSLSELRALGFSISLDDFGAGYSSFNHLKELPIDVLKIDRAFIIELESNKESRIIASTIIQLAKALKLIVIAEGVETLEQLEFLRSQGCDIAQGFYYFRPMRPDYLSEVYKQIDGKTFEELKK